MSEAITGAEALRMEAEQRERLKAADDPYRAELREDLDHHIRRVRESPQNMWSYYGYWKVRDDLHPDVSFPEGYRTLTRALGNDVDMDAAWEGYVEMRLGRYGGEL